MPARNTSTPILLVTSCNSTTGPTVGTTRYGDAYLRHGFDFYSNIRKVYAAEKVMWMARSPAVTLPDQMSRRGHLVT